MHNISIDKLLVTDLTKFDLKLINESERLRLIQQLTANTRMVADPAKLELREQLIKSLKKED